jgi:hypothetical protein
MSSVTVNVVVCAPILTAWLAVCRTLYVSRRRERRQQAEWERMRPSLSALDADLDRIWSAEEKRIRRYG